MLKQWRSSCLCRKLRRFTQPGSFAADVTLCDFSSLASCYAGCKDRVPTVNTISTWKNALFMDQALTFSVPRLHTDRLTLREYRVDDFDLFADHLLNAESSAYLGSADRQSAWRIFNSHAGMWLLNGAGWWSIEDRQTGQLLGTVGAFFRCDSTVMEMGWNTYRAFWGQGIANEAAAAVLAYGFEVRREPKLRALISAGNASSRRVAERLGMSYEMKTELNGKEIDCYTRERT
ncbi:Protein N-acetyltransferase, RimJ/RimL family [Massilia yuzhufengensis]|uniref:Protein N-acetyltransferase, RimJ/RimL family n=2 Tax=Massilia yuzhufengensis TaxID=1164594 RepID=A0A1I1WHH3_9BURK|nr:Protein N-acetyltransferase, RimJ/RimL family [Massilia yuzhufengensis]